MLSIEEQLRRYVDATADGVSPTTMSDVVLTTEQPIVTAPARRREPNRMRRRSLILAASAVVLIGVVVGVASWFGNETDVVEVNPVSTTAKSQPPPPATTTQSQPPPTTATPDDGSVPTAVRPDEIITDPLGIDLDPWLQDAPPNWGLVNGPYLIFDTDNVPDGWKLVTVSGSEQPDPASVLLGLPTYHFGAEFVDPDGRFFFLDTTAFSNSHLAQMPAEGDPVAIRDQPGIVTDRTLVWIEQDQLTVFITTDTPDSETPDLMVQLAESLSPVMADVLPLTERPSHFTPGDVAPPQPPTLGGTIGGHSWRFAVTDGGRGGQDSVDGRVEGTYLFGATPPIVTPSNQSTDISPQARVIGRYSGKPGGVLIYGVVPDTTPIDHLVVETSTGATIQLPTVHLAEFNLIAFAVPVATDLDLTRIRFLDDTGTQHYELTLPRFPRSAGGTGPLPTALIEGAVTDLFQN